MDKFVGRNKVFRLAQIEIDNLNNPLSIKEIDLYLKTFPQRKL